MPAVAGAIVPGPRIGPSFTRDGGGPILPHDLTIAASGGLLLWFGRYGFNLGSTLSAVCRLHSLQEIGRKLHGQRVEPIEHLRIDESHRRK